MANCSHGTIYNFVVCFNFWRVFVGYYLSQALDHLSWLIMTAAVTLVVSIYFCTNNLSSHHLRWNVRTEDRLFRYLSKPGILGKLCILYICYSWVRAKYSHWPGPAIPEIPLPAVHCTMPSSAPPQTCKKWKPVRARYQDITYVFLKKWSKGL